MSLLQVSDLHIAIEDTHILRGVDLALDKGQTLGVVGESGCGKSMTGLALIGMLPSSGRITFGSIHFDGEELAGAEEKVWRRIRGRRIAMVMQDPFTSLNPLMRVGDQIAEVFRLHGAVSRKEAKALAIQMLDKVGVPEPESSTKKFPHQMSGGQRQRIVIAIAMAAKPSLLIADEPTTALDVTLQAQILHLLKDLQSETQMGLILISHDIGVIGAMSDQIAVYYAGRVVEQGTAESILRTPAHPYTKALLDAVPAVGRDRLAAIEGQPPNLARLSPGCAFAPRCKHRFDRCSNEPNLIPVAEAHSSACWLAEPAGSDSKTASQT